MDFLKLNADVSTVVFGFLSPEDNFNIYKTSKEWSDIIYKRYFQTKFKNKSRKDLLVYLNAYVNNTDICKTAAIKNWRVTEEDLNKIPCSVMPNPHYKTGGFMYLFKLHQVIEQSLLKFESLEDLYTYNNKMEQRSLKNRDTRQKRKLKREEDLRTHLKIYDVGIRSDSSLCKGYINGSLDRIWTLGSISRRVCQMKFLFEHKNMYKVMKRIIRESYDYIPKDMLIDEAEEEILERSGGYPHLWPWINYKSKSYSDLVQMCIDEDLDDCTYAKTKEELLDILKRDLIYVKLNF